MTRLTITNVQLLRFFAAASVLFSHTANLLLPPTSVVWSVPWTAGVDLFFVISGFIMTWLTEGHFGQAGASLRYLVRRLIRIVPPYWFFTAVMILTVIFFGDHVRNTTIEPIQIATSLAFIPWPRHDGAINPILSQGWTLNYEIFFYCCFSGALLARRGLLLLACGFIALALLHPLVPQQWFILRFYSDPIILEFVGGIAIARLYLSGVRISRATAIGGCAAAVFVFLALRSFAVEQRFFQFGIPSLLIGASWMLRSEPTRIGPMRRFMVRGGDASYTLYLSHTFTINAVVLLWSAAVGAWPLMALVLGLATAVAVAMLFYHLAEAPVTAWLGRVTHRPVARGPASVAP